MRPTPVPGTRVSCVAWAASDADPYHRRSLLARHPRPFPRNLLRSPRREKPGQVAPACHTRGTGVAVTVSLTRPYAAYHLRTCVHVRSGSGGKPAGKAGHVGMAPPDLSSGRARVGWPSGPAELVYLYSGRPSLELLGPDAFVRAGFSYPFCLPDRFRPESAPSPDPFPTLKEPAENIDS